jgi:F0F1-type ATP synthase beta subunit
VKTPEGGGFTLAKGKVVQVIGPVVDIEFPAGELPEILNAITIKGKADKVDIDLFIIVEYGISISAVAAAIIETVKYKVEHLTGVPVGRVNVCVEDIRV